MLFISKVLSSYFKKGNTMFFAAALLLFMAASTLAWGAGGSDYRWYQSYAPAGGAPAFSALLAAVPVVVMFFLLGLKKPSHVAAISALLATFLLATLVWKMPVALAVSSTTMGMAMAVFPILWTLTSAVWIFNMLVDSGYFEVVKKSLGYVTGDRRMQTILIGFGFTTLLESMAAFGAPIAIVSAMLVGFGFPPMLAGVIALLADTTPSAWGTQSMPIVVLNSVTSLDINSLAATIGRQTPVASALSPAVLVLVLSGWRGFKGVWPVAAAVGLAYGLMAAFSATFLSPYVVGITAALAAIITTLAILRFWRPAENWLLASDCPSSGSDQCEPRLPARQILRAWSPYFLLVLVIGIVNSTGLKSLLASISTIKIPWPGLHNIVWKTAPVVSSPEAYSAVYSQPLLLVGGSLVFFTGLLTVAALGIRPARAFVVYINTLKQALKPGVTIVSILGIAYLMNYSAMTYSIGLSFASAGFWFPMATVFLGMLGCTLAGSVAASNALFGNLSVVAGQQLGIDPVLSAGTLCSGGTMGKAIAPQDLVIASATLNLQGQEGELLRRVLGVSVLLAGVIGAVAMLQQHLFR